jgi:TIR domain
MSLNARPSPQVDLEHPWLGLASFSESTRRYFFGRDAEGAELLQRLRLHPLLVLYGRSGLGKTSLLRAKLIPELEKLGARPAFYRISYRKGEASPLDQLAGALDAGACIDLPDFVLPNDPASRLWLNFHHRERKDRITHLILDQFEEIFTLGAEWPGADAEVREALAIFVQGAIPPPVETLLDEGEAFFKHFHLDVPPLPVLLAVREDYVFALNRWRSHLRQLGENHYELRALRGPAAFKAVFNPGELRCHYRGDVSEETKADTGLAPIVSEETAARIVHFVAEKKEDVPLEEIEAVPPILSLLCRELNERRFAKPAGTPEEPASRLTLNTVETDIETIITIFYERCLDGVPEAVRIFIEEEFVSRYSGARLQQDEQSILTVFADGCAIRGTYRIALGFGNRDAARACLEDLINQRLLTAIGGSENPSYELTHDLLAAVAGRSRTAREERFAKEEAARSAPRTEVALDAAFWEDLLVRIREGDIVPLVGPGAVTFGAGNELLYPWLAQRLSVDLRPPLAFERPPRNIQEVVYAQRAKGQPVDRIYRNLHRIVENPDLRPGVTLSALAAVEGFQLFISTTFDPLLPRAVVSASPGGRLEERRGASSLRGPCPDLPLELMNMQKPEQRYVYQILGRAQPYRDFVVWDDDMFRFLFRLDQELSLLPKLSEALHKSDFLVLGLGFADWLLRLFVQVVKHQPVSELAGSELFVFESLDPAEHDKVVIYFSRLTKQIRVFPIDPIDFIAELHRRWRKKHPAVVGDPYLMQNAHREKNRTPGCIFVSYASPDIEIARYVVSQLQKAGCLVWFDKEQLLPGKDWEEELREVVEERCGLFVSIISDHTAVRLQGYNIFERNLAAKRREKLADNAFFYLPLRIDNGEPLIPENEPHGTKKIQGVRKPSGHLDEEFIGYLRDKQRENCAAFGYPVPPNPA